MNTIISSENRKRKPLILIIIITLLLLLLGTITTAIILNLNQDNFLEFEGISFNNETYVYDGNEHVLRVHGHPQDTTITYTGNRGTNAGIYQAQAILNKEGYREKIFTAVLTIEKSIIDLSSISFVDRTYTYDASEKHLELDGDIPSGVSVAFSNNSYTNIGIYNIQVSFVPNDPLNYSVSITSMEAVLIIDSANILANFDDYEVFYDNTPHTIVASNIPDGVSVIYTYEKDSTEFISETNSGVYVIHATLSGDNYKTVVMQATLTIKKSIIDLSHLVFENITYTYDGTIKKLLVLGDIPDNIIVEYTNNAHIDAYAYAARVTFTAKESDNYVVSIYEMLAVLTINKANIIGVTFPDVEVVYTGDIYTHEIFGNIPSSTNIIYTYVNDPNTEFVGETSANSYYINATITGKNYNDLVLESILTIKKALIDTSKIEFHDDNFIYDEKLKGIFVSGVIPDNINVDYNNNTGIDANIYQATALLEPLDSNNYFVNVTSLEAVLTINPIVIDVSTVIFNDYTATYNGEFSSLVAVNVPLEINERYENNTKSEAGVYEVKVYFEPINTNYYPSVDHKTAILTINKAVLSGITMADTFVIEDGTTKSITVIGEIPAGVSINYTVNNEEFVGSIAPGSFNVTATLTSNNYENLVLTALLVINVIPTPNLSYTLINNNTEYSVSKGSATDSTVKIPQYYNNLMVTVIEELAFDGYNNMTSVILPSTLKEIGTLAFLNCTNLEHIMVIDVGNSNKIYKSENDCLIRIADNYLVLGSINSIIPDGTTTIGRDAFYGSKISGTLIMPNSVTKIEIGAFQNCSFLKGNLILPNYLVTIESYAFNGCGGITSVVIPNTVTTIESNAFRNCNALNLIIFNGTINAWNNIVKTNAFIPNKQVYCTNGVVLT